MYHLIISYSATVQMAVSRDEAGFYAGYLASSMMLGRVFSSVPWGIVADSYGRKPVILIGLATIAITSILFGLSLNFYMAIACRFILGLFNPIIGKFWYL